MPIRAIGFGAVQLAETVSWPPEPGHPSVGGMGIQQVSRSLRRYCTRPGGGAATHHLLSPMSAGCSTQQDRYIDYLIRMGSSSRSLLPPLRASTDHCPRPLIATASHTHTALRGTANGEVPPHTHSCASPMRPVIFPPFLSFVFILLPIS